jgi:uncharacterized membrane protein
MVSRTKETAVAGTMTLWMNTITGERLDRDALDVLREKARRAYEANGHIFEDEFDALTALGAVPLHRGGVRTAGLAARLCGHEAVRRPQDAARRRRSRLARGDRRVLVGA